MISHLSFHPQLSSLLISANAVGEEVGGGGSSFKWARYLVRSSVLYILVHTFTRTIDLLRSHLTLDVRSISWPAVLILIQNLCENQLADPNSHLLQNQGRAWFQISGNWAAAFKYMTYMRTYMTYMRTQVEFPISEACKWARQAVVGICRHSVVYWVHRWGFQIF